MRVLFLAQDIDLANRRGDSIHVVELARALTALGHEIRLVTATGSADAPVGLHHHRRPEDTLGQILQARKLARGWADVIYERRLSPKVAWAASRLVAIPFVVEINGILDEESKSHEAGGGAIRRKLRGHMIRRASLVVAVSEGIRDHLISAYDLASTKVAVVPNGANTSDFHPMDPQECRTKIGIPRSGHVVCFVGNLAEWQGLDQFLGAIRVVRADVPDIEVLIVGAGPEEHRLKSLAAELGLDGIAHFVGPVPHEDVPKYINASDICVAPFVGRRKASPIKVFEYLACGRAVVATDVDEIGRFLRENRAGLVVPPDDPHALSSAIRDLIEHPQEALAFGNSGRDVVLRTRSWDATARRLVSLLSTVIAN